MSLATLDTLEVVKDLRSAGFTDAQAEAVARNLRKAQDLDLSSLATKADLEAVRVEIQDVRTDLTRDIERVRTELSGEIAAVRSDLSKEIGTVRFVIADTMAEMIKWVFGAVSFQTLVVIGAIFAVIKFVRP